MIEDLSYVALLRKKFSYLESLPGVLLPHPLSSPFPFRIDGCNAPDGYSYHPGFTPPAEFYNHTNQPPMAITPSMSSLEALLSKLPSVGPSPSGSSSSFQIQQSQRPLELMGVGKVAKEKVDDRYQRKRGMDLAGESSSSMSAYHLNIANNKEF